MYSVRVLKREYEGCVDLVRKSKHRCAFFRSHTINRLIVLPKVKGQRFPSCDELELPSDCFEDVVIDRDVLSRLVHEVLSYINSHEDSNSEVSRTKVSRLRLLLVWLYSKLCSVSSHH